MHWFEHQDRTSFSGFNSGSEQEKYELIVMYVHIYKKIGEFIYIFLKMPIAIDKRKIEI